MNDGTPPPGGTDGPRRKSERHQNVNRSSSRQRDWSIADADFKLAMARYRSEQWRAWRKVCRDRLTFIGKPLAIGALTAIGTYSIAPLSGALKWLLHHALQGWAGR